MANFLLFFLSPHHQARIIPNSIQVSDEFIDHTHALKISFTIADPQNGAPEIRLLWPGRIDFRAEPNYPGAAPQPQSVELTPAAYATWPTVGTLRLKALDERARAIAQAAGDLEVAPNCLWYFPLKLSQPFLFTTIGERLGSHVIDAFGNKIQKTSGEYARNAIAWFLQGKYGPVVYADQRTQVPMPTVVMTNTGAVTLYLAAAQIRELQDGRREELNSIASNLPESDPSHPVNGSIPPRRVLQKLSAAMGDMRGTNNALLPLPQKIIEPPAQSRPLTALRFRRTWKKLPNNSRYFPTQEVMINDATTNELLLHSRIPHHGVVYFKAPGTTAAAAQIRVKILGGMRFLKGDDDTQPLWREKAVSSEATHAFNPAGPMPEIILRRPMAEEIFTEHGLASSGCTYQSMRRTIRALANNRIAGGQLNYVSLLEKKSKRQRSLDLLKQALGNAANRIKGSKPSQVVEEDEEGNVVGPGIGDLAMSLKPVWAAFFPNGDKAYSLWQSAAADWYRSDGSVEPHYQDAEPFFARGAPGALAYLGLATLHYDPRKFRDSAHSGESVDDYAKEMTQTILAGLSPGALLQFWLKHEGYEILKTRRATEAEKAKPRQLFVGHSLIFERYNAANGVIVGIHVRDQNGNQGVPVSLLPSGRLRWFGREPDIWLAANWDE